MTWENDKKWSDKYIPEIKRNLGQHLISEPENFKEDKEHNTDLTILQLNPYRIACRIRKDKYREKYGNEFTIRASRPITGHKTELTKIIEGWGDYFFYGFANDEHLTQWFIGDLKAFRLWFNRELWKMDKGLMPGIEQHNFDGSSGFRAFDKNAIPDFIVAESAGETA